ncbi:MAG: glycosyltransferase family 2 protein [Muribaculaceae bacterium]|nr:glycosyltransferase family 2 protein [Muribaculaceae bacterium]
MATYNGEAYLPEQLSSILSELKEDDELVVSDDGSTDATCRIIESLRDPRIRLLHNKGRHGVNGNFENAIKNAKGDYIFLSDQDDVWLKGKRDACVKALATADCVVHDCIVVDKDKNITEESFFRMRNSGPGFWKNLYRNSYLGCCMAFRRGILETALPYPEDLPVFQEGWIASLADIKGSVEFIPFKGILFRRHDSNSSATAGKSGMGLRRQIGYRLKFLGQIIKRLIKIG